MQTILVAIDFSEVTASALVQATKLAMVFGSKVHLVHVAAPEPSFVGYEPGPDVVRHQIATELREEHRLLHGFANDMRAQGIDAHALLLQGSTSETIVDRATKTAADLIVIGSHGHGALHRALLGSVSEGIVRHAPCLVLIIPAKPPA